MYTKTLLDMLAAVRAEAARRYEPVERYESISDSDESDGSAYNAAFDKWSFEDGPFISDLCLLLLVALWHEVEREVVKLAARSAFGGRAISHDEYEDRLRVERRKWIRSKDETIHLLRLQEAPTWRDIELLRRIANSYKHEPSYGPAKDLREALHLDERARYAALAESDAVREAISIRLGLLSSDFCDIAAEFIRRAKAFADWVERTAKISKFKPEAASFNPDDFLQ